MRQFYFVLSALLLSSCALINEKQNVQDPVFNPQLSAALQAALEASLKIQNADAITASLYISEQCFWTGSAGKVKYSNTSVRSDTLFNFGSITKTFVAAIILQLAEEKQMTLEDPLGKWLKDYPHIDSNITIRQLLNHGSGIYNFTQNDSFWSDVTTHPDRVWLPEDILQYVKPPIAHGFNPPDYSNTNYILLGLIIESVTGSSVENELQKRIVYPLRLEDTHLANNKFDVKRWSNRETLTQSMFSSVWTAGAIASTSKNIAKWSHRLYSGEFLEPNSLQSMFVTKARGTSSGRRISAGLGVMKLRLKHEFGWGHNGWLPPFISKTMYLPKYNLSLAYASSGGDIDKLSAPGSHLFSTYLNNLPDDISLCSKARS